MLSGHLALLRHQLGRPLKVGDHPYRMRGFFASRLARGDSHEPQLAAVISRALKETTGAFIDVGVNTGQTFMKVIAADPTRTYVGFEPSIECCHYLKRFIEDNRIRNANLIPVALADANGLQAFYSDGACDEMASLENKHGHATWVQTRVGDEILAEMDLGRIGVVKVDVEGAELRVFRGLQNTLATYRPQVLFEQLPNFEGVGTRVRLSAERAERNSANAESLWSLLTGNGYSVRQVLDSGETRKIDAFSLDDVDHYFGRDYIALPS